MKEDILEQLVDEYLMHKGYFTMHNVKFKPRSDHPDYIREKDAVASDIDGLAIHPLIQGPERVIAVSCKSWQEGFNPGYSLGCISSDKKIGGRTAWLSFRELCSDKWADAFLNAVEVRTGTRQFVYWTAVTRLLNPASQTGWEENSDFRQRLEGNPIRLVAFADMLDDVWDQLSKTVAATELGRMIQLMKASRWFGR
ncbi:MAG TPA: hypothetical protein VFS91_08465 [Nitrobacter sp.]|nr:hypothetical protein [Nitrobacter sp.]